jgi:hypothetical protein
VEDGHSAPARDDNGIGGDPGCAGERGVGHGTQATAYRRTNREDLMASIGGDTNTLLRRFMNRGKRKNDMQTGTPGRKATYRPRKQGTVAPYKPGKKY